MSYSRGMGVDIASTSETGKSGSTQNAGSYETKVGGEGAMPAPPCAQGSYRDAQGRCGPVVYEGARAMPNVNVIPVSSWRVDIQHMLEAIPASVMSLGETVIAPLMVILFSLGAETQREMEGIWRDLTSPSVSDVQAARGINTARERYRQMRQNIPAPVKLVVDPVVDLVGRTVPPAIAPPALRTPISGAPCPIRAMLNSAPWGWITGSFVAGWITGSILGGKKTTPNGRVRRNRRPR